MGGTMGALVTLSLSVLGSAAIGLILKAVLGLRPTLDAEEQGLDDADHGEAGYHLDEGGGHGEGMGAGMGVPVKAPGFAQAHERG